MSAHSSRALKCSCGGFFIFSEYHWPHCQHNPERQPGSKTSLFERKPMFTASPTPYRR